MTINMTINITIIAIWVAQFNLYLWKRKLPKYHGFILQIAETKIDRIERAIARAKATDLRFIRWNS